MNLENLRIGLDWTIEIFGQEERKGEREGGRQKKNSKMKRKTGRQQREEGRKRKGEKKEDSEHVCFMYPWVLCYITCTISFCLNGSDSCLLHLQPKKSVFSTS